MRQKCGTNCGWMRFALRKTSFSVCPGNQWLYTKAVASMWRHCFNTKDLSPLSPFFILQIVVCFIGMFSEVKLVLPVTPSQSFLLINASLTTEGSVEPDSLIASASRKKVS